MDEGGVVEAGVDDDVGDVELSVAERLGRRAHVVPISSESHPRKSITLTNL